MPFAWYATCTLVPTFKNVEFYQCSLNYQAPFFYIPFPIIADYQGIV